MLTGVLKGKLASAVVAKADTEAGSITKESMMGTREEQGELNCTLLCTILFGMHNIILDCRLLPSDQGWKGALVQWPNNWKHSAHLRGQLLSCAYATRLEEQNCSILKERLHH